MVVTAFLFVASHADPSFFCTFKENADFWRVGDLDFYKECSNLCDCKIQELVCLRKYDSNSEQKKVPSIVDFKLTYESVNFAENCPETECICNNDSERWSE